MKHIPEPDVVWLRDPGASVNRLTVHSTWRSRRPLQMLSSTWQVTGVSDTAAELIERTPHQRNFEATSVPGVLEMDGAWVRREEEARRAAEAQGESAPDQVRASILRREFILDAPLKDASERGWTMTLTFGGFTGPLYVWVDGSFVGFCPDGFIPAAFDVTDALEPMHTHEISVLLVDSPACCHGLFREVSLEARPPAHVIDVIPRASHDGTSGSLRLRVECSEASNTSTIRAALLGEGQQEEIWSASAPAGEDLEASGVDVLPWSAEEPVLYTLVVTLSAKDGTEDTVALQVGFRGLETSPKNVRLGGRPLALRGVRRNECHPRTGLAVGLPEMLEDIVWCKRHGVNAIEISDAPVHARFYELADEYGLYIIDRPSALHRSSEALAEAVEAAIRRDRAHPSVIAWSLGTRRGSIRRSSMSRLARRLSSPWSGRPRACARCRYGCPTARGGLRQASRSGEASCLPRLRGFCRQRAARANAERGAPNVGGGHREPSPALPPTGDRPWRGGPTSALRRRPRRAVLRWGRAPTTCPTGRRRPPTRSRRRRRTASRRWQRSR